MEYIYESPDGGKTIYRYPRGHYDQRELYRSESGLYHQPAGFDFSLTIDEDGIVIIDLGR